MRVRVDIHTDDHDEGAPEIHAHASEGHAWVTIDTGTAGVSFHGSNQDQLAAFLRGLAVLVEREPEDTIVVAPGLT